MSSPYRPALAALGAVAAAGFIGVVASALWPVMVGLGLFALVAGVVAVVCGVRQREWGAVTIGAVAMLPVVLAVLWLAALLWAAAHGGLD